jgi:S-adenosylmethionine:tRNA ribosyltransferase-isomerase
MNLTELEYDLPPERIAQRPLARRDASRLLLLDRSTGKWEDRQFAEFPSLLEGNELAVVNNARVIPARLFGFRAGVRAQSLGKNNPDRSSFLKSCIEVLLVRPLAEPATWEALVRPGRKIGVGETIIFGEGELEAHVEARGSFGLRRLRFSPTEGFEVAISRLGHVPLPPYIRRADEPADRERYQTIFAREARAVAAPTAALHFTPEVTSRMHERGIEFAEITLDVGLGTFEPVRTKILEQHRIHTETYEIPPATAEAISRARAAKRPVVAIGTTVVRALEDAAAKSLAGFPDSSRPSHPASDISIRPGRAEADLFLYPGKEFRVVDRMLTNFHLPRSSLLALVAAFAGLDHVLAAYRHAVDTGYRFYSYGDCMFIR